MQERTFLGKRDESEFETVHNGEALCLDTQLLISEILTRVEATLTQLKKSELMHAFLDGVVDHLHEERP